MVTHIAFLIRICASFKCNVPISKINYTRSNKNIEKKEINAYSLALVHTVFSTIFVQEIENRPDVSKSNNFFGTGSIIFIISAYVTESRFIGKIFQLEAQQLFSFLYNTGTICKIFPLLVFWGLPNTTHRTNSLYLMIFIYSFVYRLDSKPSKKTTS